jgi:hypothetical protein
VGYDSAYEDEEDGWSVVGDGGRCGVGAEPVDRIDVVRLGALGRFGSLVETEEEDIPLGMDSTIVLVTIQSFNLCLVWSAGFGNKSDGSRKGSSGEAGHQGSEQQ